jgi:hypothetical protein
MVSSVVVYGAQAMCGGRHPDSCLSSMAEMGLISRWGVPLRMMTAKMGLNHETAEMAQGHVGDEHQGLFRLVISSWKCNPALHYWTASQGLRL